ncbi:metal ABC transporter ATP-binding protein [Methylobacterium brachythecii]|uniref:Zinc/manganese transport system ATP-binding protein n=1 Tax=Methylobacterium brachythecii TaxID=1176177 RepID=A0A7W6F6C3_9HYPH|nr:ABC transporter ATP-binding protein [Methylobacterium brachythecii]MBB3902178.1 zinc/manganese transport system ATP-binding protein [Methylobacterium brachythecii]
MSDAIHIHCLTLGYDRHPAVHHLDGSIAAGDMLALVGPNGAGKSTLLKGLVGEIPVLDGRIERGTSAGAVAYLPQATEIDRSFPLSVLDLVAMGLWRRLGAWRSLRRGRAACEAAIAAVGLSGFEARPIGTLSGGQFQRALFARLIVQDARVILLDEPFTGIDARTVGDLIALISGWHEQGRTVVAALHDFAQVRAHFPTTLLLAREPIAWGPTSAVLTPDNLERARQLSEAWDETAAICRHDHEAHDHGPDHHREHDHAAHGAHDHHHGHGSPREAAE